MTGNAYVQRRPTQSRLPRIARRRIVAAAGTIFALLLAAQLFFVVPDSLASSILRMAIVLLTLATFALVMTRSIHWFVGNAPDAALDERERALRDRCYFHAYTLYAGLTVAGGFYFVDLAPDLGLWMPDHPQRWWALSWGLLILALALPAALVAWSEADPAAEN